MDSAIVTTIFEIDCYYSVSTSNLKLDIVVECVFKAVCNALWNLTRTWDPVLLADGWAIAAADAVRLNMLWNDAERPLKNNNEY